MLRMSSVQVCRAGAHRRSRLILRAALTALALALHGPELRAQPAVSGDSPTPTVGAAAPLPRTSLSGPSAVPDAAARKEAKRLEKEGNAAAGAGDCQAALGAFRKAFELAGGEGALVAAADCEERSGHFVEAYDLVTELLQKQPQAVPATRAAHEQKLAELAGKTAVLTLTVSEPGSVTELDGVAVDLSPSRGGLRLLPGEYDVRVTKAEFTPFETKLTLAAGSSQALDAKLVHVAVPPPTVDRGEVRDFCYMKVPRDTTRYHKQRLVLFGMAGEEAINGPEAEENAKGEALKGVERHVLREVNFHSHARNVFLSTFPLERFYMVNALVDSPDALKNHALVPDAEMIRAATVDPFAAYSIACADWVVMPRVTGKRATWKPVKRQRTVNNKTVDYMAWDLSIVWKLQADVYRHGNNGWQLAQTVHGSNGGLFGLALGLAASAPQKGNMPPEPLVSKRPAPSCSVPLLPALSKFTQSASDCESAAGELRASTAGVIAESAGGVAPKSETPDAQAGSSSAEPQSALVGTAEQAAVDAARGKPGTALETAAAGASPQAAAVVHVAASVQDTVKACKEPIEAVAEAKDQLRALSHPDPGALALQATVGLAGCAGIEFTADLSTATAPGAAQLHSSYCENVRDDVALGDQAMQAVARCGARVGIEGATLALQKSAKQLDGWRMFATLQRLAHNTDSSRFGIALGQSEGLHRGDLYVAFVRAPDGSSSRAGYGRIQLVGPGGSDAQQQPSQLKLRSGSADQGVRVEEHPQVGVPLGVRPQADLFVSSGSLKTTVAYGAALEGGYNASQFAPVGDEVWGKIFISYMQGSDQESFVGLELMPEILHYLGSGFAVYGTSGFAAVFAMKSVDAGATVGGKLVSAKTDISGFALGAGLGGGLDYSPAPDWVVRLSALYRQGFSGTKLEDKGKTLALNAGSLSAGQGGVSAAYIF